MFQTFLENVQFWGSVRMYMIILWIVVAILAVIFESESADLISIWFSLGAVGGVIAAILDARIITQVAVFAIVSFLLVIVTRPLVSKLTRNTEVYTNSDRMIGKVVEVAQEIPAYGKGEVIVDFRSWGAISLNNQIYSAGEKVVVVKIEGNKLVVDSIQDIHIK